MCGDSNLSSTGFASLQNIAIPDSVDEIRNRGIDTPPPGFEGFALAMLFR
jgi:hypothetical protein